MAVKGAIIVILLVIIGVISYQYIWKPNNPSKTFSSAFKDAGESVKDGWDGLTSAVSGDIDNSDSRGQLGRYAQLQQLKQQQQFQLQQQQQQRQLQQQYQRQQQQDEPSAYSEGVTGCPCGDDYPSNMDLDMGTQLSSIY